MLLTKAKVRRSLKVVKAAFPRFGDWEFINEIDESHPGFALWGVFVSSADDDDFMPRRFFVTFDIYGTSWRGYLSIGQHSYFWSSADFGDAVLLDTESCATLEDAITMLKSRMVDLFEVFLDSDAK